MLFVTDSNGKTISQVSLSYKEANGQTGAVVTITATIHESDTSLTGRWVSASLNWNDGSGQAISLGQVSLDTLGGQWTVTASKRLLPGNYVVVLRAQNYRAPREDIAQVNFFVTVVPSKAPYVPPALIFGPILPRDSGFPNDQQWEFQLDSDILILESSIKMLLLTAKGDRIMEPDYGTNIRRLLFEPNIASTESLIRNEITTALTAWEPRVSLVGMNVTSDPNGRSMTLDLTLVSKLTRQPFQTSVEFVR